jgi:DNA-binding IclR family transcriptional regulator
LKSGVVLLRLVATAGRKGLALTELSQMGGCRTLRHIEVLAQLIAENLKAQDAQTRRYRLGQPAFELSSSAPANAAMCATS